MRFTTGSSLFYSLLYLLNLFFPWCFIARSRLVPIWGNNTLSQIQCQELCQNKKDHFFFYGGSLKSYAAS